MISIDTTNRIVINGTRTNLAVTQNGNGTVVYTPESVLKQQAYKEHAMPHKRYSLAHDTPASGVAGRAQFEADICALIATLISENMCPIQSKSTLTVQCNTPRTKTERFLASFQSVVIRDEHRNHGDESPCLRDCGIPASIATKLIHWAETVVGPEGLVSTLEQGNTGKNQKTWHWMEAFLQDAFRKHTEMFGDDDLPDAARRMRDTGTCFL